MFPKAFAANRDALLDDGGCFSAGERVAFNRVARIGQFHAKPLFEIADKGRGERAIAVQLLLPFGQVVVVHGGARPGRM